MLELLDLFVLLLKGFEVRVELLVVNGRGVVVESSKIEQVLVRVLVRA